MPDERIVLEAADLGRAWRRVAHEIAEATAEGSSLMLVGIQRGGVALAQQLSETLAGLYGHPVATGSVEPGLHRDDLSQRGMSELRPTHPVSYTHLRATGTVLDLVSSHLHEK